MKVDLRDICGEDRLASALGVGTNDVGGLWKQLVGVPEQQRQSKLVVIASSIARDLGVVNGHYASQNNYSAAEVEVIVKKYRVSPRIVTPLVKLLGSDDLKPASVGADGNPYHFIPY